MPVPTVADRSDTPAVALGPTALFFGFTATVGVWVPWFALLALPWTIIGGGLAVTLGAAGIHHARLGTGRMGVAVAGTVLGAVALIGVFALVAAMSV